MPLTMVQPGEIHNIVRITGNQETRQFLENLGFVIGGKVSVVALVEGNLIVNVKDARVAIGKEMANRIFV